MSDRVKFIAQKRKALSREIQRVAAMIRPEEFDIFEARARMDRVRMLFYAYEELHDELVISEVDIPGQKEMEVLNKTFYRLFATIKAESQQRSSQANASASTPSIPMGNSTFLEKQKQMKLPTAEVPKFSDKIEQWLSFRNSFKSMIDSRTDIDNVVKFHYLKNSLQGEAADKLDVYEPSDENCAKAWQTLTDEYERRRTLLDKHLDAIQDIPSLTRTTYSALNKLSNDARQNIYMLELLNLRLADESQYVIVRTLERKLPDDIRLEWEKSLERDEAPTFEKFFKFLGSVSARVRTLESEAERKKANLGKRSSEHVPQHSKAKRGVSGSRALATTVYKCDQCQGDHPLYKCPTFVQSTI